MNGTSQNFQGLHLGTIRKTCTTFIVYTQNMKLQSFFFDEIGSISC